MATDNPITWLEKLEGQLNVDVDYLDPEYIKNMPIIPHDQTSNPVFVDLALGDESNASLLESTAKALKEKGWLATYTRMAVLLCKKNIDNIKGRVFLQTLPSKAYDTQATVEHALLYDQEFKLAGIPRERYCIKLPATGPALNAAKILSAEGITTLGTALFSLPQAIACSQADMKYISPFLNELRVHEDMSLWPDVEDPAIEHPMSARVVQILDTYKNLYSTTGKEQPLVKLASFISPKEAMAAGEFGCHSATISYSVLDQLAELKYDSAKPNGESVPKPEHVYKFAGPTPERLQKLAKIDPLAAKDWDGKLASVEVDYLADGGKELEMAISKDPCTMTRLKDTLDIFTRGENRSKEKVEAALAACG